MAIKVIHTKEEFIDERGGIAFIMDQNELPIRAVLRATSKAGSIRSNHYHKKDSHYLYVESGKCEYYEKPVDKPNTKLERAVLEPGDLVLTIPNIIHAVKFLEDTVLYAFTTESRGQDEYEKDTVRVKLVE
jgi:quercetin dioxygenase-like cupin family protein